MPTTRTDVDQSVQLRYTFRAEGMNNWPATNMVGEFVDLQLAEDGIEVELPQCREARR